MDTISPQSISLEKFTDFKDKFLKEAQTLVRFDHPNIVRVTDVFEENQTAYMVMRFIDGLTLSQLIKNKTILSEFESIKYITQIANAVQLMHQHNILHRDLKPDNIIIDPSGKAVLIDFGTARDFADGKTITHTAMLTPGFAPLEQYSERQSRGAFTDIYSLGATLYCCLTGKKPLQATDRRAMGEGAEIDHLERPSLLNPEISVNTEKVILKALQIISSDRYQSIRDFLIDFSDSEMPKSFDSDETVFIKKDNIEQKKQDYLDLFETFFEDGSISDNERKQLFKKQTLLGLDSNTIKEIETGIINKFNKNKKIEPNAPKYNYHTDNKKSKKSGLVISAIISFILIGGFALYWFFVRSSTDVLNLNLVCPSSDAITLRKIEISDTATVFYMHYLSKDSSGSPWVELKNEEFLNRMIDVENNKEYKMLYSQNINNNRYSNISLAKGDTINFTLIFEPLAKTIKQVHLIEGSLENITGWHFYNINLRENNISDSLDLKLSGWLNFMNRNYGLAITEFSNWISDNSEDADAYYKRGRVYSAQDEYENAIADFEAAINNAKNYFNSETKERDETAKYYYQIATAYHNLENYKDAIKFYTNAIDYSKTKNSDYYYYRGKCYLNLNKTDNALEDYTSAITFSDQPVRTKKYYSSRAYLKYNSEDYKAAMKDIDEVLKIDNNYADAYFLRAKIFSFKYDKYIEAIADYDKYIELDPTYSLAYYYRGIAKFSNKDKSGACKDFKQVISLGNEDITSDSDFMMYKMLACDIKY